MCCGLLYQKIIWLLKFHGINRFYNKLKKMRLFAFAFISDTQGVMTAARADIVR